MLTLAIDSSGTVASCALVSEKGLIAEFSINNGLTHSQTLMPMINIMFDKSGIALSDVDFLSVANGPGSFTGLRIGLACAKGIAFGLNKKIVPVSTLDALAYNIFEQKKTIVPIMDARRDQVYTALYQFENSELKLISERFADSIDVLFDRIDNLKLSCVFLGDGVFVHRNRVLEMGHAIAPANSLLQRASSVGALGLKLFEKEAVDPNNAELSYLRLPQAEREYLNKNG